MQIVNNLSSIIMDAKNAEDAAVLIIEHLDRIGFPIKKQYELEQNVVYKLMLERVTSSSEVLRIKLAIAIAQDVEADVPYKEIARVIMAMIYHFGIELDTIATMDDELEVIGDMIRRNRDDANMAAVTLIDYLDRNGYEIEENGYLDDDEFYGRYACNLS